MSDPSYHEPFDHLSRKARNRHRAYVSLIEEIEAVDWYEQRVDQVDDEELKSILKHNRDEELEHAAMLLEWLRRQDETLDEELRDNLFKEGSIAH